VLTARELQSHPNGAHVAVAGVVLLRQRPGTAKGITFVTLEDETGVTNLIVHPRTWENYYRTAKRCPAWVVRGELQHSPEGILHVVAGKVEPIGEDARTGTMRSVSRDFR
jgi:error-prone DNA polymerase